MTEISDIVPGHGPDGTPAAFVGDTTYADLGQLLQAEPALMAPEAAAGLALHVTHFARDGAYAVIDDPKSFESAYRERLEREDPNQPWQQNVMRLRDFGVPDFSAIHAPAHEGDALVFYASDALTGLPYRVTAPLSELSSPDFAPLPLTPASAPPRATNASRQPQMQAPEPSAETTRKADQAQADTPPQFDPLPDDLPSLDD